MKRLFFTVAVVLSVTLASAENGNMNSASTVNNVKAYDLSVNMKQLARTLRLAEDQKEAVVEVYNTFCSEVMFAAQYPKEECNARMDAAIKKNLGYMNYILTPEQYKKYRMLLNLTMLNRGLR